MSSVITNKIDVVRRKHALTGAGMGISNIILIIVGVLALTMLVDLYFDLPYMVRAVILAIHVGGIMVLLGRYVIWPLLKGPDDETVALWIESFYPDSASRIISAVQFSRPEPATAGTSTLMIGAAVREAENYLADRDTADVIEVDSTMKRFGIAMLLLVVASGLFIWGRPGSVSLLKRALAVPNVEVPRETRVELLTDADRIIARGDSVQFAARAIGVVPTDGRMRVRYESGATADFTLKSDPEHKDQFALKLDNVQDSFSYRIYLNDGRSESARIDAKIRPSVTKIDVQQHFPSYTRLNPIKRSTGDLTLLAGSRLKIDVQSNKPVRAGSSIEPGGNRLIFAGSSAVYPLERDPNNPQQLFARDGTQITIPVPDDATGMSVELVDEFGLTSRDSAVYRIVVVPDELPKVTINSPTEREELVTNKAHTVIDYLVEDDFGVTAVRLRYKPAAAVVEMKGDGLKAEWFANVDLTGPAKTTTVLSNINGNFRNPPIPGLPGENFTGRLTGKLLVPKAGSYVFSVKTDDGIRMYINNELVIDCWGAGVFEKSSEPMKLEQGFADIRYEYLQLSGDGFSTLNWTIEEERRPVVIPAGLFFTDDDAIRASQDKLTRAVDLQPPTSAGGRPSGTTVRGQYDWNYSLLNLNPGDIFEWWIEADDAADKPSRGRAESEHRTLRIGTDAQVLEKLLLKGADVNSRTTEIKNTMEDVTDNVGRIDPNKLKK